MTMTTTVHDLFAGGYRRELHAAELVRSSYGGTTQLLVDAIRPAGARHSLGYTLVVPIEMGATQAYLLYSKRATVLVFPGTATRRDWVDNLSVWRVSWPPGSAAIGGVHGGFARQYGRVQSDLARKADRAREASGGRKGEQPLFIFGHSLGGALALLAAIDLAESRPVEHVVTFEAPRVGDERFATEYHRVLHQKTTRVVCGLPSGRLDLVARSPASALGYRHNGQPLIFWKGEVLHSVDDWQRLRQENPVPVWMTLLVITRLRAQIAVHGMDHVIDVLRDEASPF